MKKRVDFVTNSSSSSYVIAYKRNIEVDDETAKKYPFVKLYDLLVKSIIEDKDYIDTEEAEVFETEDAYNKSFLDRYGYYGSTIDEIIENNDYCREEYNKAKSYFENGYAIMRKCVGDHNSSLINIINTMADDNDNFIVLCGDEW